MDTNKTKTLARLVILELHAMFVGRHYHSQLFMLTQVTLQRAHNLP